MKKRLITDNDYERLDMFLVKPPTELRNSEILKKFSVEFLAAEVHPHDSISRRIITMNTWVRLRELKSKKEIEMTITYPKDANSHERKISVFSEIGLALLGRCLGDVVTWPTPFGAGQFEIIEVTYQPEAVGDYHL
jgi:regulator of nucleoside diphosphate kinase